MTNPKDGNLFYIINSGDCRKENLEKKMTFSQLIDLMIGGNLQVAAISTSFLESDMGEELFKSEGGIVESFRSYRIFLMPGEEKNRINKIKECTGEKTDEDKKSLEIFLEKLTADIDKIESAAVIDDMGDVLAISGMSTGVNEDDFLDQISTLYGTSKKEGEILKKGAVDEMDVIWEKGMYILKNIDEKYFLQVITSEGANLAWTRSDISTKLSELRKILEEEK